MKKVFKNLTRWMIISISSLSLSCSNVFKGTQDMSSDEANYEDALKALNNSDFVTAVAKFQMLSNNYLNNSERPEIRFNYAGALAGRCGFGINALMTSINNANSAAIFKFFMNLYTDIDVNPDDCIAAENIIKSFGSTAASRSTNQNLFMALLSIAKIGTILRANADQDGTNGWGDGTADAAFNACTVASNPAADATALTDAEVSEVATGFGLLLENLGFVTAAGIGGDAITDLGTLASACDTLGTPSPCRYTNTADVTATDRELFRDLLKTAAGSTIFKFGIHEIPGTPAGCNPVDANSANPLGLQQACCP